MFPEDSEKPPGGLDKESRRPRPKVAPRGGDRVRWRGGGGPCSGVVEAVADDSVLHVRDDADGAVRDLPAGLARRFVPRRRKVAFIEAVGEAEPVPPRRVAVVVPAPGAAGWPLGVQGRADVPGYRGLVAAYGVRTNGGRTYSTAEVYLAMPGFEPAPGRLAGTSRIVEPLEPAEVPVTPANLVVVVRPGDPANTAGAAGPAG
ncbi:MAG TPA: hypothetical protein VG406_15965, partial [Isosphaeraceae bacterium]|nr:hypothetical protein [Isosphaeraceae bacterium]